jgi:hypothetical protein
MEPPQAFLEKTPKSGKQRGWDFGQGQVLQRQTSWPDSCDASHEHF